MIIPLRKVNLVGINCYFLPDIRNNPMRDRSVWTPEYPIGRGTITSILEVLATEPRPVNGLSTPIPTKI